MSELEEDQCIRCSRRMQPEELEADPAGGEYCLVCLKTKMAEAESDIRDLETERDDVAACIRRIEFGDSNHGTWELVFRGGQVEVHLGDSRRGSRE